MLLLLFSRAVQIAADAAATSARLLAGLRRLDFLSFALLHTTAALSVEKTERTRMSWPPNFLTFHHPKMTAQSFRLTKLCTTTALEG